MRENVLLLVMILYEVNLQNHGDDIHWMVITEGGHHERQTFNTNFTVG